MSGPKAYTLREMKGIVEYLVEHKAYGELKGRKMWMDFSNTSLTNRSWQSLKETFLKRILPDIQNPYYHLTRDQVCSFRQGYDVAEKEKHNRLEIQRGSEQPSKHAENQNVTEQPSTSAEKPNEVDKTPGEDLQSEKISTRNRSSAETLILEDNARTSHDNSTEDLRADLEGPAQRTMKECLDFEYSEPPSVVRAVLDDFETDSEDSGEPAVEIVDSSNKDVNKDKEQDVIVVEDSENTENVELIEKEVMIVEGGKEVEVGPTHDAEVITDVTTNNLDNWLKDCAKEEVKEQTEINDPDETNTEPETSNTINVSHEETIVIEDSEAIIENTEKPAENENINEIPIENDSNNANSLSTTNDTIIPNNQETLNADVVKTNGISEESAPKKVTSRKRSTSVEQSVSKKIKLSNGPEKTNGNIEATSPSPINTEALVEAVKNADSTEDITHATQDVQSIDESHKNPCLKSVSLFEEQFNTTKYTDSEEDDTPIAKNDLKQTETTNSTEVIIKLESTSNQDEEAIVIDSQKNRNETVPNQNDQEVIARQEIENRNETVSIQKDQEVITCLEIGNHDKNDVILIEHQVTENTTKSKTNKNVIVLHANSDSDNMEAPVIAKQSERYKRLEQAFGFVPGTSTTAQHKRFIQNRRRARPHANSRGRVESSDWEATYTDPDELEAFVSPPRGRRNRAGRLYKKPASGRIVSSEEEGRLYVMFGNKVFPLVSDGKDLNYVHYDGSDDEEDSTWRKKYIDERKKAAELRKQLDQAKLASEMGAPQQNEPSISKTTVPNGGTSTSVSAPTTTDVNKDSKMNITQGDSGKIQITLCNNKEQKINLEGHWPQVLPIMQQVMSMFYKPDGAVNGNTKVDGTAPNVQQKEVQQKEVDSGRTTPIIPVVDIAARKVDELEREIFKEIEEREKVDEKDKTDPSANVTKRKARTPSNNSDKSDISTKRSRTSKQSLQANADTKTDNKKAESKTQDKTTKSATLTISDRSSTDSKDKSTGKVKDKAASKTKVAKNTEAKDSSEIGAKAKIKEDKDDDEDKVKKLKIPSFEPRVTRSRSGNETDTSSQSQTRKSRKAKANSDDEDEDVRYMLPPGPKSRRSAVKTTPTKARSSENPHEISQERCNNSVDSTQGYQDSDASPMNVTKRKKKLGLVIKRGKHVRRRSFPSVTIDNMSLDSSNSSYFVPKKSSSQPTLDSAIYKSESYRILMGGRKLSITKLDAIDECNKNEDVGHFNAVSKITNDSIVIEIGTGSSSIVSLPLSPELSVVDNLSLSREMIANVSHPTINEHQANDSVVSNIYNQYIIADVDVSVPLMQQECELLDSPEKKAAKKVKKPKAPTKSPIKLSSFLNKMCTVNVAVNSTLSDTLDQRLRDLLLESAKKNPDSNKENLMDVDEPIPKKKVGKKRCSTPRKRDTKKSKAAVGPIIDEHMESCSKDGRKSCPPLTTFVVMDENANNSADVVLKPKKPARVKKDIIKVKIQRPLKAKVTECNTSQGSVYTDSGINESVSINGALRENDNIELIHNHSETCLEAHECIGNSIEFLDNSKSHSAITLDSSGSLESELAKIMKDMEKISQEYKNRSANASAGKSSDEIFVTPATTVYHSPVNLANSSLITEDFSDEAYPSPPGKWYLLSEDETNTNPHLRPDQMTSNMRSSNYLEQIFPITCAIPDLSTISEMSKENEGSRKTSEEDTRSCGFLN